MWSLPLSAAKPIGEFCNVAISVSSPASRLPNCRFVVGGAGPGFLLRFAIVVAGQFLDRGAEDRRQHRRVRRQERPHRGFGQGLSHRTHHMPIQFQNQRDGAADQQNL